MNFKDSILNKGKTKLYSKYWDVVTDTYVEKLGA